MASGNRVVDKYYGWVIDRMQGALKHAQDSRGVLGRALDPTSAQSYSTTVKEIIQLGLECYDNAYGWMYPYVSGSDPTAPPTPTASQANASGHVRAPRPAASPSKPAHQAKRKAGK
jgi:hypothetical protein